MEENNNFLDKNTILAIGLSIVFFMGWQYYVQQKYPNAFKDKEVQTQQAQKNDKHENHAEDAVKAAAANTEIVVDQNTPAPKPALKLADAHISTEKLSATLSSLGMGLKNAKLKNYTDREDNSILFENGSMGGSNFATLYKGKPLNFSIKKISDTEFSGVAQADGMTFSKVLKVNPENYTFDVELNVSGAAQTSEVSTSISNRVLKVESSFLTPAYEGTEFFVINEGSEERERIDIKSPFTEEYRQSTLASIGSQYFAVAVKDNSGVTPVSQVSYHPNDEIAYSSLIYKVRPGEVTNISFTGFMGPKKYDLLKTLDSEFVQMINYGMFSVLSKPIFSMLKWIYGVFQNWGLAIILLTVFIRLILLPINISSLRSMKKMQKIQPQLKAIKEKYKDDPVRVNQETMALMKKEKANPLGGCLPMLLQLPVFFALYSVLGQSVELYKSPFALWIQDLSYRDPFFVLPIAVGALYFVQMSLSPPPADPAQAKVMKFIPLLFCFFMITVPAGLTLYFFVNTVFGIGQTFIFQREKRKAA